MKDPIVGHFFNEVIELDLSSHLPVICDFWESVLFDLAIYRGNPMTKHIALNDKSPMQKQHFERWLQLWRETVRSEYKGTLAEKAITKAEQIGSLMEYKIEESQKRGFLL